MTVETPFFNVFVGAETGLLKGVNTEKKTFANLNDIKTLDRKEEITAMCWSDGSEREICIGKRNQVVQFYSAEKKLFIGELEVKAGSGPPKGLAKVNGNLLMAVESGTIILWDDTKDHKVKIDAGENLYCMRQNPQKAWIIATGGKENDLKIWDLNEPQKPTFTAKNVRPDFLDLRVPVWVTDMQFIPDTERIVACTGYHHVRVYDPNTSQRRPVINMEFDEYPLTSLSLAHQEHQVIVGNSRGTMGLLDLRKKRLVHSYKGFAGSIRSICSHPCLPFVVSCGLDRFLRVHDLHSHQLMTKMYLKSRLNCLLLRTQFSLEEEMEEKQEGVAATNAHVEEIDMEEEAIWDNMQIVSELSKSVKSSQRQQKCTLNPQKNIQHDTKRRKQSSAITGKEHKRKKKKEA